MEDRVMVIRREEDRGGDHGWKFDAFSGKGGQMPCKSIYRHSRLLL
jgi:hypothetical protein